MRVHLTNKSGLQNRSKAAVLLLVLFLMGNAFTAKAQGTLAELQVFVARMKTPDVPLKGAQVTLYSLPPELKGEDSQRRTGTFVASEISNASGMVFFANLQPGDYRMVSIFDRLIPDTTDINVHSGTNEERKVFITDFNDIKTDSVIVLKAKTKIIDVTSVGGGKITGKDLTTFPADPVKSLISTNPLISSNNGSAIIRGARPGSVQYLVDNAKDDGSGLSTLGTEQISATIGGVPANRGDFTGGAFEWVSKGATSKHVSAFEVQNSRGLDPFGYNTIAGFASGPLLFKRFKLNGQTEKYIKLGYVANGQVSFLKDNSPSILGTYAVKPDVLTELQQNPLVLTPNGYVYRAAFLTNSDFDHLNAHPNSSGLSSNGYLKLEYRPAKELTITGYAKFNYSSGNAGGNSILNFNANPRSDSRGITAYLQLTQNLKRNEDGHFKGGFYTVRLDYASQFSQTRDASHLDRIFDYGYIGKFNQYQTEVFSYSAQDNNPNKAPKVVTDQYGRKVQLRDYWEQSGWRDTLLTFESSDVNSARAAYTEAVYRYFASREARIENSNQLQNSLGLLNGQNPGLIYSLFAAPGTNTSGWSKSQTDRYSLFSQIQFRLGQSDQVVRRVPVHEIQFGFFAEQQVSRGYRLDANSLWTLMPQLMNRQLSQMDLDHPILSYDANGYFTDTVRYNRLVNASEQTVFDRNFRNYLMQKGAEDANGKKINEHSLVNVNSFNPNDLKLDMFSADELLNNGNSLVRYYGYDHLGNKVNRRPSAADFLNSQNRSIDAFRPVYMAAWVQDQFRFRDLILRLGLRAERYDANQMVLADQWSLYPIKTAGEVKAINGLEAHHPANIGDDYKVYVNDINAPSKIVGYRKDDRWFNADGSEQKNPEFLANQTSNGKIAPMLEDPNNQNITAASLKDFKAALNLLPRIWFSFPLKPEKSSFYVCYDVLAQRPSSNASFLTIDELYYMKNRQGIVANGQLGSRQRTNYEVGFKNIFGKKENKAIEIGLNYSEIRKDFGLYQVGQAYPMTYITYRNIDFSTITGFQAGFTMKDIGPLSLYAGYLLQYADGTGSNINSQAALIASNQPNLRTVIPLGELDTRHTLKANAIFEFGGGRDRVSHKNLYQGPTIGGVELFRDMVFNITANAYSGLPYTPTTRAVQVGATDRAQVKGVPFGARMPWQKVLDINIIRNFRLRGHSTIQVFLAVQNLLNTKNISSVFAYTGQASDDGFLNSPQGQQAIRNQVSAQSFADYYKIMLNTQSSSYNSPRLTRLGLRVFLN